MDIFKKDSDRMEYLNFLRSQGDRFGVKFLSYCPMTNHVHLLAVPEKTDSLARAIGEAHRLYTRMINFRERVRGYLFQGRFSSCPVSTDNYLLAAIQYILRNPVKAKWLNILGIINGPVQVTIVDREHMTSLSRMMNCYPLSITGKSFSVLRPS